MKKNIQTRKIKCFDRNKYILIHILYRQQHTVLHVIEYYIQYTYMYNVHERALV